MQCHQQEESSNMSANVQKFLDQKVRETITKCNVAGLGAVLVSKDNGMIYSTQGSRKLGAAGNQNNIQSVDKWCLGSVSKPVTGTLIGVLIQKGIGNLAWTTKLKDVFPEIQTMPGAKSQYFNVTLEQFMAHSSGMLYNPTTEPGDQWLPLTPLDPANMNDANLMERRRKFVYASVLDQPQFPAGTSKLYGGGPIICAAMVEKRTGIRFEKLLKQHVYDSLGMSNSGWGVASPGPLDGPWEHYWDDASYKLVPNEATHIAPYNFGSHGVSGSLSTSAPDMGKFIHEHLRADPQVMSVATRTSIQSALPAAGSDTTRGSWVCLNKAAPTTADIWHNGDNGSMYADLILHRSAGWGSASFSNVNSRFGSPAVYDLQEAMGAMIAHWKELFTVSSIPFWECAHPQPALTQAVGNQWLFSRKHTGALVRRKLPLGGTPVAPVEFPAGVFTSGVASASSADGQKIHVMARGTDNRIWRGWSTNGGTSWEGFEPIRFGTFLTGPAVAMSSDGVFIHVFAVGMDSKMYRTRSIDGGKSWIDWEAIGAGVFTSQPAAACSTNGKIVHVFGRGLDFRVWRNLSIHSGVSWNAHWEPIGQGIFSAGPAATCNGAGSKVYVAARGTDRAIWSNITADSGTNWGPHWKKIPEGTFTSAPSIEISDDGVSLTVVALGGDFGVWRNKSVNDGSNWDGWSKIGSGYYL
jgi:CubicO group peptidase (beta-lactamase class C family)